MHGSESRCSPTSAVMQLAVWMSLRVMSKALVLKGLVLKAGSVNLLQPWVVMGGRGLGLLGLVMQLYINLE